MSKSVTSVPELGALANNLTHSYSDLAAESCRIAQACPSPQVIIVITRTQPTPSVKNWMILMATYPC